MKANIIFLAGLVFSSLSFAQAKTESFSCADKSLGDVVISVETVNGSYSLFSHEGDKKTLVDQGLDCKFSTDGKNLFLCSKRLVGPEDFVQYYSETTVIESMMDPSASTSFYRQGRDGDVRKSKTRIALIYGATQEQCK